MTPTLIVWGAGAAADAGAEDIIKTIPANKKTSTIQKLFLFM
jgi:hypothetical protein